MLNATEEIIYQGWPESIGDLPTVVTLFWSFQDEESLEDGVILKGE